jgi:type II secretory pathway component PulF
MARYNYIAKSEPSKTVEGKIEADSPQDAVQKIAKLGLFPVSVAAESSAAQDKKFWPFGRVRKKEIVLFTNQLATLVGSGVNIIKSLNLATEQVTGRYLKATLIACTERVKDGKALSESLGEYPDVFNSIYTSMIRSGEASGNIEEALKRLSGHLEKEEEFRDTLRQAMVYPAFIFTVSALTILVLLGFVIPRLVSMFGDMGQALPLPTKVLIAVSSGLRSYWWVIPILVFMSVFIWQRMKLTAQGRGTIDNLKIKFPIFGQVILKAEISRFMRTLSLLVAGGMPITPALDVAVSALENQILRQEASKFKDAINEGKTLSEAFRSSKLFPEFTVNIVSIGEETGSLEKAFLRVAQDYEKEVDAVLKNVARLIEPVIILVMGLIVCFIVLSMLLPIFQINLIVR